MNLMDWLKDGLLTHRARYRRTTRHPTRAEREERDAPSGRRDFGRRAHRPDPNGRYGFGDDPGQRMLRPKSG